MQFWPWNKSPKLVYEQAAHQVEVRLSRKWALSENKFPTSLIKKTTALLEAHKLSGEIKSYVVHEGRLRGAWQALRNKVDEEEGFTITCITGIGIPVLEGITVTGVKGEHGPLKTIAYLTILAPRTVIANWRTEWVEAFITEKLRSVEIMDAPHPGQLESIILRAAAGESAERVPLMRRPAAEIMTEDQVNISNFSILANHTRKEVYVTLQNPWFLR